MPNPKITFIGAGSTVFMKNIVGDVLQREALRDARFALMDINPQRLDESAVIAGKMIQTLGTKATIETFADQRKALEGSDFVVVCFQIGGGGPGAGAGGAGGRAAATGAGPAAARRAAGG